MKQSIAILNHPQVKELYLNQAAVDRYAGYFRDTPRLRRKDQREKRCIEKAMAGVLPGATVLDLPCGTGRLYSFLKQRALNVVSADASPYMVSYAQRRAKEMGYGSSPRDRFEVADVLETGFEDYQFDVVICNRLFHHFHESSTRRQALQELRRICSGPIIVSFFSTIATDALKFYYKKNIKHKVIRDRIPISPIQFAEDVHQSGLEIERWFPVRPLMSMQWYVRLRSC